MLLQRPGLVGMRRFRSLCESQRSRRGNKWGWPQGFFIRIRLTMLHVCQLSGQLLATMAQDEIQSVQALRRSLQAKCGVPRFRQKLLREDGTALEDGDSLQATYLTYLQLVVLPLPREASPEDAEDLAKAAEDGSLRQLEDMLRKPLDPDLMFAGKTSLSLAACKGHLDVARLLLEAGADKDKVTDGGWIRTTALGLAAGEGHVDVVCLLLQARADCNKVEVTTSVVTSATPLGLASMKGHMKIIHLLLDAGADKEVVSKVRQTHATPLGLAASTGQLEVVHLLLESLEGQASQADQDGGEGEAPLALAAGKGHGSIVRRLLEAKADKDKGSNGDWFRATALGFASAEGHLDIMRLLIEAQADKDKVELSEQPGQKSKRSATPLALAAFEGRMDVLQLLLNAGADKNVASRVGRSEASPLGFACVRGQLSIVQLLLDLGAEKDGVQGAAPLVLASGRGHVAIVNLLLTANVKLEQTASVGGVKMTALGYAAQEGHQEALRQLLAAGCNVDGENGGCAPLSLASGADNTAIVQLLLEAKADKDKLSYYGTSYVTPLGAAALHGQLATVRLLLGAGADKDGRNGRAPLTLAASRDHMHVVRTLLDANADKDKISDIADGLQLTPLASACHHGHTQVARLLLEVGADKDGTGGAAPLALASSGGHVHIVSLLLQEGADKNNVVSSGKWHHTTALGFASMAGHTKVAQLLLESGVTVDGDGTWTSPLAGAAFKGHLDMVRMLLEAGQRRIRSRVSEASSQRLLAWHPRVATKTLFASCWPTGLM
ncbi:Ank2 [Symbiodinium natans]|uniref:Ank2 protein n=1 Tax=Symbiodinium natans TaxID=878477 RepID=A0A812U1Q0_9DINO|nr:Ank2 [Symbiodinium natans]